MGVFDLFTVPFRWASAVRHRRVFHPGGVMAIGSIERTALRDTGLPLPSASVIARISKAAGTPGDLPDAIGLALRVTAPADWPNDWDVLLASAGSGVFTRAVGLRPVTSWVGKSLTSLVPLSYQGENWWLRARLVTEIDASGLSLNDIRRSIETRSLTFELDQARAASHFVPLGRLTLTALWDGDDVSFDPVLNSAPGVSLYPRWLADLRARAYGQSREGRDADQARAERTR